MTQQTFSIGARFLDDGIFQALRQYGIQNHGALPASMQVNPRNLDDIGVILAGMGLERIAVTADMHVGIHKIRLPAA